jgi:osmotically-inducible protein OsmY
MRDYREHDQDLGGLREWSNRDRSGERDSDFERRRYGNDVYRQDYAGDSGNWGNQGRFGRGWSDPDSMRYGGQGRSRSDDMARYGDGHSGSGPWGGEDYSSSYGRGEGHGLMQSSARRIGGSFGGYGAYGTGRFEGYGQPNYEGRQTQHDRGRYAGVGPKGYQRSDERIREDVSDRFMEDDELNAGEIEVNVSGGIVTLTGSVDDRYQKRRAEDLAEDCPGVKDVRNELSVAHHYKVEDRSGNSSRGQGYAGSSQQQYQQGETQSQDESRSPLETLRDKVSENF